MQLKSPLIASPSPSPQVPLAEVITDFFDQLKSRTKGYSSMSFTEIGFRTDNLVKLDIRINGEDAPPLATIVHRDKAHDIGKRVCDKLKELIPRQQFKVRIRQAATPNSLHHHLFSSRASFLHF